MRTYATLDGEMYDLDALASAEREHFECAFAAYAAGMDWSRFMNTLVDGPENPLIEPGRRITRRTLDSPLYRVLLDLGSRLGIQQGRFQPAPGDDPAANPLQDAGLLVAEAARHAGVSVKAVYLAIERGDLIATRTRPARVSERSFRRWIINAARQEAGRKATRHAS